MSTVDDVLAVESAIEAAGEEVRAAFKRILMDRENLGDELSNVRPALNAMRATVQAVWNIVEDEGPLLLIGRGVIRDVIMQKTGGYGFARKA